MHRPLALLVLILAIALPSIRFAAAAPAGAEGPARGAAKAGAAKAEKKAPRAGKGRKKAGKAARTGKGAAKTGKGLATGAKAARGKAGADAKKAAPKTAKAPETPPVSVGHPNDGRLEGGVRLDTSRKDIRVVPAYAAGDVRWGLPGLVGMIERAATAVAKKFPGSVLEVGDLSRKGGGEVHRHHSHESGRDADIGFYAVDAKGKQVRARTFLRFDAGLKSTNVPGARFDVARNWLVIQRMLTDRRARVSHIFLAEHLRAALLAHAKKIGVSRALLDRAQIAMMQPTAAEAHDDHMHVRISCPRAPRGQCIELAKNAPTGRDRARARASAASPRARARGKAAGVKTSRPPKTGAQGRNKERAGAARRPSPGLSGVASQDAPADPAEAARGVLHEPLELIDRVLRRRPSSSPREAREIGDDAEAQDALDDSGVPKITD